MRCGGGSEPDGDGFAAGVVARGAWVFEAVDDFVIVFDLVFEFGEFFVVFADEAFERLDAPTELLELTGE